MENALENSAKCINYALNLANANQKASIQKILEELNQCRNSMNLNSNENQIENSDQEMQNADKAQSTQNSQKENDTSKCEKKSFSIEMRIEKTIEKKMRKIQTHLNKKLNQMMNLIQSRTSETNVQISQNVNTISLISRQKSNTNRSSSTSWAQVVSRNTTKNVKMQEKKKSAKIAKSDAWLSKRMIARSKNPISNINSNEYRNKINDALKLHKKSDVLVQTVQLSRTEQHIVFTTTENINAEKLIEYRNI